MAERLAELAERKNEALHAGSPRAVERHHAKGKLTARERIEYLLDEGSFQELDMLARHRAHGMGLEDNRPYTDGVVTGFGTIDGRRVCVFSQDFTVFGGALGEVFAEKIHKVMDLAASTGVPMIGLNDGAGARIQEGVVSLHSYGGIFHRNVAASGVIPQISVILGPCAGGAVYSPAMTDFIFMVQETSHMFITGPDVVKTVTGEDVTLEELGGAMSHATKSGVATFVAPDEKACLDDVRYLLSFLPSNNLEEPPIELDGRRPRPRGDRAARPPAHVAEPAVRHEEGHRRGRRRRRVLRGAPPLGDVDHVRVRPHQRPRRRHRGQPAGGAGRRARHRLVGEGGRFVRTCDAFNIPLVTFVDVPGFLPGTDQEYGGIIRHGAKLLYAYCEATVPAHPDHHAQGLRRRLRRHELQVDRRRPGLRLAVGRARRHGPAGRRRDRLPARAGRGGRPGARAGRADRRVHRALRQPVRRRRARLRRRRDLPGRDARRDRRSLDMLASKREELPRRKHGNVPL